MYPVSIGTWLKSSLVLPGLRDNLEYVGAAVHFFGEIQSISAFLGLFFSFFIIFAKIIQNHPKSPIFITHKNSEIFKIGLVLSNQFY